MQRSYSCDTPGPIMLPMAARNPRTPFAFSGEEPPMPPNAQPPQTCGLTVPFLA